MTKYADAKSRGNPLHEVRVKPHSYQPSKAELEEPIILRKPDGSAPTVDEVVSAVVRPVKVVEDPDA